MNMTFDEFLEVTTYSAPYAARKILYAPKSRPAVMARALGFDFSKQSDEEQKRIRRVVANKEEGSTSKAEENTHSNTPVNHKNNTAHDGDSPSVAPSPLAPHRSTVAMTPGSAAVCGLHSKESRA